MPANIRGLRKLSFFSTNNDLIRRKRSKPSAHINQNIYLKKRREGVQRRRGREEKMHKIIELQQLVLP